MPTDEIAEALRGWIEAVRAWVLEQPWLGFLHDWIASASSAMIWGVIVVSVAALILLVGFCWPVRKPNPQRQ